MLGHADTAYPPPTSKRRGQVLVSPYLTGSRSTALASQRAGSLKQGSFPAHLATTPPSTPAFNLAVHGPWSQLYPGSAVQWGSLNEGTLRLDLIRVLLVLLSCTIVTSLPGAVSEPIVLIFCFPMVPSLRVLFSVDSRCQDLRSPPTVPGDWLDLRYHTHAAHRCA